MIKKVLITGNLGFVGSATQRFLENLGIEVIGYDLMSGQDIRDIAQVEKVILETQPDRILHLAAIARFRDADLNPLLAYETNVGSTGNLAAIAGKYHIPIVYSSTGSVYMPITQEPPITEEFEAKGNSVYGCSKYTGELCIKKFAHPWIILRYAHLYGKEKRMHGLIGGYLDRIKFGMSPVLYGGKQSNDFCYIEDIARANYLALIAPWDKWNQVYNIGTGEELSAEKAGDKVIKIYNELNPYKKFEGNIEIREGRTVDPLRFVFDVTRAERMLGFKAQYNYEQGLREMLKDGEL